MRCEVGQCGVMCMCLASKKPSSPEVTRHKQGNTAVMGCKLPKGALLTQQVPRSRRHCLACGYPTLAHNHTAGSCPTLNNRNVTQARNR